MQDLYQQHFNEMFSTAGIEKYSPEDVDRILDRLIRCLPNNGKLYKYRSGDGQAFEYAFDGLKNGYLYLPPACDLNDDLDCTLFFDPVKEVEDMAQEFFDHPWFYLNNWITANRDQIQWYTPMAKRKCELVLSCVDKQTWELNTEKALKLLARNGMSLSKARTCIKDLNDFVNITIEKHAEKMKKSVSSLVNLNNTNRQGIYVFSLSEDFDSNNMWGLYANGNRGFCIEYDFNKAKLLNAESKRLLMALFKIVYKEKLDYFSFKKLISCAILGKMDLDLQREFFLSTASALLTKTSNWSNEKEWRIMIGNLGKNNKIFADIVSAIIIDERILQHDNGKKLIELAREKGWSVKVRRRNILGTEHVYSKLNREEQR